MSFLRTRSDELRWLEILDCKSGVVRLYSYSDWQAYDLIEKKTTIQWNPGGPAIA